MKPRPNRQANTLAPREGVSDLKVRLWPLGRVELFVFGIEPL